MTLNYGFEILSPVAERGGSSDASEMRVQSTMCVERARNTCRDKFVWNGAREISILTGTRLLRTLMIKSSSSLPLWYAFQTSKSGSNTPRYQARSECLSEAIRDCISSGTVLMETQAEYPIELALDTREHTLVLRSVAFKLEPRRGAG